jgi:hypothetical protein
MIYSIGKPEVRAKSDLMSHPEGLLEHDEHRAKKVREAVARCDRRCGFLGLVTRLGWQNGRERFAPGPKGNCSTHPLEEKRPLINGLWNACNM